VIGELPLKPGVKDIFNALFNRVAIKFTGASGIII
jgi:hypothetical protein